MIDGRQWFGIITDSCMNSHFKYFQVVWWNDASKTHTCKWPNGSKLRNRSLTSISSFEMCGLRIGAFAPVNMVIETWLIALWWATTRFFSKDRWSFHDAKSSGRTAYPWPMGRNSSTSSNFMKQDLSVPGRLEYLQEGYILLQSK